MDLGAAADGSWGSRAAKPLPHPITARDPRDASRVGKQEAEAEVACFFSLVPFFFLQSDGVCVGVFEGVCVGGGRAG